MRSDGRFTGIESAWATSTRDGSNRFRSKPARRLRRLLGTSNGIRCGRGWWTGPTRGDGQASGEWSTVQRTNSRFCPPGVWRDGHVREIGCPMCNARSPRRNTMRYEHARPGAAPSVTPSGRGSSLGSTDWTPPSAPEDDRRPLLDIHQGPGSSLQSPARISMSSSWNWAWWRSAISWPTRAPFCMSWGREVRAFCPTGVWWNRMISRSSSSVNSSW